MTTRTKYSNIFAYLANGLIFYGCFHVVKDRVWILPGDNWVHLYTQILAFLCEEKDIFIGG
jgi:hypothetical protein